MNWGAWTWAAWASVILLACSDSSQVDGNGDEAIGAIHQSAMKGTPGAAVGDSDYCGASNSHLCGLGEGPCSESSQCASGYTCITGNLAKRGPFSGGACAPSTCSDGSKNSGESSIDCGGPCGSDCTVTCDTSNGSTSHCSTDCPCSAGEGDCDSVYECQPGLVCGNGNGAAFHLSAGTDVCWGTTCQNGVKDGSETAVDCGGTCAPCAPPTPGPVTLVSSSDTVLSIVIAPHSDQNLQNKIVAIANDLRDKLNTIKGLTGAQFSVAAATNTPSGISLGIDGDFPNTGWPYQGYFRPNDTLAGGVLRPQRLQLAEQYVLHTPQNSNRVIVAGATVDALQNAVSDLLARIGYRHYFPSPTWEVFPEPATLQQPLSLAVDEKPAVPSRTLNFPGDGWEAGFTTVSNSYFDAWRKHNRLYTSAALAPGGSYAQVVTWWQNKYGVTFPPALSTNPATSPGNRQLCLTGVANAAGEEWTVQKIVNRWASEQNAATRLSLSPTANVTWVSVPDSSGTGLNCNDVNDPTFRNISNRVAAVLNAAAEAQPTKVVVADFLYDSAEAPTIALRQNAIVNVHTTYVAPIPFALENRVRGWGSVGFEAGITDAISGSANEFPGQAQISTQSIVDRIRTFYDLGVRRYELNVNWGFGASGPAWWALSNALWDLDTPSAVNAATYRSDFLTKAFGPAAGDMNNFYEVIEDRALWSDNLVGVMYRALKKAYEATTENTTVNQRIRLRLDDLAVYTRYLELSRKFWNRCDAQSPDSEQSQLRDLLRFTYATRDRRILESYDAIAEIVQGVPNCTGTVEPTSGPACDMPVWNPTCPSATGTATCGSCSGATPPAGCNPMKTAPAPLPSEIFSYVSSGALNVPILDTAVDPTLIKDFTRDLVPYQLTPTLPKRLQSIYTRQPHYFFFQRPSSAGPLTAHVIKYSPAEILAGRLSLPGTPNIGLEYRFLSDAVPETETDWVFDSASPNTVYRLDLDDSGSRMYTTVPDGTAIAIPISAKDQPLALNYRWQGYFFVPAGTTRVVGWSQSDGTFFRNKKNAAGTAWITEPARYLSDYAVGHACTNPHDIANGGLSGLWDHFIIPIPGGAPTDELWYFNDGAIGTVGERVLLNVPPYLYQGPEGLLVPREVSPEGTTPTSCISDGDCTGGRFCPQSGTCQTDTGVCTTSAQCRTSQSCNGGTCVCSNLSACSDTCRCPTGGECDSDRDCVLGSPCENGTCQGTSCDHDGDCTTSSLCINQHCIPNCTANPQLPGCAQALCSDGIKDGAETDVDCGGACARCTPGKRCTADVDCSNGNICGADQGPRYGLPRGVDVCLPASCLDDPQMLGCGAAGAVCGPHCLNAVPCDPNLSEQCTSDEICTIGLQLSSSGLPSAACAPAICGTSAAAQHCGSFDSECGECQCAPSCTGKGCGEDDGCGRPCSNACENGDTCSSNSECHAGSVCGFGIGEHFGHAAGSNACWPVSCANGEAGPECPWIEAANCVGDFCDECPLGSFPSDAGCVSTAFSIQPGGANFPFPIGPFPTNPVGATPASFEVSPNGLALYTIPIEVPPGRLGIQPAIALSYSSTKADGPLGIGWSLTGLSSISRCRSVVGREGAARSVRFDSEDRFCLDGQPLVQVPSNPPVPYGESGAEYRTELDSATKIVAFGGTAESGPTTFQAWMRDGRILTFGGPAAAWPERLTELNANVFVDTAETKITRIWGLSRVEDRAGNVMKVKYRQHWSMGAGRYGWHRLDMVQDTGEILPELIAYGGKTIENPGDLELPGRNATRFVRFSYEDRPDQLRHYLAGALGYSKQRLTQVQTYVEGDLIRSYNLSYQQVGSGSSQLESVQECAPDTAAGSTVCKGATRFDYFAKRDLDPIQDIRETAAQSQTGTEAIVIDTNGDGADELLTYRGHAFQGNHYMYQWNLAQGSLGTNGEIAFNNLQGEFAIPGPSGNQDSRYYRSCIGQHSVADLNRDGKDELYYMCNDRRREDYPNALIGYEWTGASWIERSSGLFPHFDGSAEFADLNGDGVKDLVWCELRDASDAGPRQIGFALGKLGEVGTYAGFEPAVLPGTISDCRKLRVLDVDGDGADDLLRSNVVDSEKWTSIYSFEAEDFVPFVFFDNEKQKAIDFNGDGLKDVLLKKQNGESFIIGFNNGAGVNNPNPNGGFEAEGFTDAGIEGDINPTDVFVADVDGDGKEDIVTGLQWISYVGPGQIAVHELFVTRTPDSPASTFDFKHGTFADLDGDGEAEYVFQQGKRFLKWTRPARARLLSASTTGLGKRFEVQYDGWATYADRDSPTEFARRTYAPPFGCQFETSSRFLCAKRMSGMVSATYETQLSTDSTPFPVPIRKLGPERHYSYRDLRIGLGGRGSFGVGGRTVSLGTLSKTLESYANKDFRTAGHIEQSSTTIGNQAEPGPFGGAMAQCALSQIQWEIHGGSSPNTWFTFERSKSDFEGHPFQSVCNWVSHRSITTEPTDVDEYGNLLKQTEVLQKRGPDGTSSVTRVYTTPRINRSNWILGLT